MFGYILLFAAIYFIVWPIIKLWLRIRRARRAASNPEDLFAALFGQQAQAQQKRRQKTRSPFSAFTGNPADDDGGGDSDTSRRKGGWSRPAPRRKKIDPSVGEFVKFKEVKVEASAQASQQSFSHTETEQQISDVQFTEV